MSTPDRRLHAARLDLADERLRGRVEAARYVRGEARRVAAPSCPVRRGPRDDAATDTEALAGEAVTVFEVAAGHAWVQIEDGYVGYVPAEALGALDPVPTHRVAALRTFLYPGPSLKLPPDGFLSLGARVAVAGREAAYARLACGRWLFAGHLAPLARTEPDFVAVAERLLGTPYLWGGRTSLGLDCSGLLQLALDAAGIAAPRDTDMQEGALGEPLDAAAGLRRGDLVFWRGHVGIMRDPRTLLHANGHDMAVASEPLAVAESRILAGGGGPVTSLRRLPHPGTPG